MRLLYVYKEPDENSVIKSTTWIVYTSHIYLKSVFFLKAGAPIYTFDSWVKKGELAQIGKPNEDK